MKLHLCVVDAFTQVRFAGNAAAVVFLEDDNVIDDDLKQKIAREMNLSETAFVSKLYREDDFASSSSFKLRWFTPSNEVPLCGHATLATSAAIFEAVGNDSSELHFESLSGPLSATRTTDGLIALNFPARGTEPVAKLQYSDLIQAVVGDVPVSDVRYSPEERKLLVRLHDHCNRALLESLTPSIGRMLEVEPSGRVKGVTVTLRASAENDCGPYDFVSRYFAPWYGIPEDPVTGSAHTVLGPYWSDVLGKTNLFARQASTRGGQLFLSILEGGERISIGGYSTIVVNGELHV
ncbi:phenazine biosynthesis-like domain-containing protein isoform X2 [Ornithodoros turicata]|uniref:phenazine biosynthesis-like domain-containing protein isoform X2 n=1 Tax=Ornithodoros turicata TaxID=34597 RepID=UPI00313A33AD